MNGIVISDIDDTLIKADPGDIGIWKYKDGKETRLSTEEFAKDPDKDDPTVKFDYREFNEPKKVRDSIINGTPLLKNLKIIDRYLNKGYDFTFLTARGAEDIIKDVMADFMKYRDETGHLQQIGAKFKDTLSYAVNDEKYCEIFDGIKDFDRKAKVIKMIAEMYDDCIFLDDDTRNLVAVKRLNLPNVKVIRAMKESTSEHHNERGHHVDQNVSSRAHKLHQIQ